VVASAEANRLPRERQLESPRPPEHPANPEIEVLMELRSYARCATVMASVLAIVACGNREVGTEPGGSELVVVVNTPIARAGAVAIHGPAASTMRVAATDTLRGLTAGEYLARAEDASAPDSLVSPVLVGVMSDSAVLLADGETKSITGTYTVRGGSGALWVGKWGHVNLAEGFTSPQLAAAGTAVATDTVGAASATINSSGTAFDSAGNLWVTDYINQKIRKFTPAQLASGGSAAAVTISTQKEPWGIALDSHGNLWVGFYNGNYVLRYAASDVAGWSGALTDPAPALSIATPIGPLGLAFDAQGNLWVGGFDLPQTYEIDATQLAGSGSIVPTDSLVSSYLDHGSALAFDRAGNLWEGTENGFIVSFTAAQLSVASHGEPAIAQQSVGYAFDGLAFDNSGNLWGTTEGPDVAMYSPAQQASGELTLATRTLTASTGERTFGLAFNTHDAALPIAATLISGTNAARTARLPRPTAVRRSAPPVPHTGDGSRPGSVVRR
jgi:sugar lactone lactonase YvrE